MKATNTNENILSININGSNLIAFLGEKEVELIINKTETLKIPRKLWNSFAGSSLQMAREVNVNGYL